MQKCLLIPKVFASELLFHGFCLFKSHFSPQIYPHPWKSTNNQWFFNDFAVPFINIGQHWSTLVNIGQHRSLLIHIDPPVQHTRINIDRQWSTLVNIWSTHWSTLMNIDQHRQHWPTLINIVQHWSKVTNIDHHWWTLINIDQHWTVALTLALSINNGIFQSARVFCWHYLVTVEAGSGGAWSLEKVLCIHDQRYYRASAPLSPPIAEL